MYEDDDELEGPKSSFDTYFAEGDVLFKKGEFKKALESYSLALELQPADKACLVARSKCYLGLGDTETALRDAEAALSEDKEYNKGLYQKAEALYSMGDFEYALMYYHRGYKLRPELDEFRLGIQKAQEAIDNAIGGAAKVKLENKGDLSFFAKQDESKKAAKGYSKPKTQTTRQQQQPSNRGKATKSPAASDKTVKQLLGELYADKEYLEKLMSDQDFIHQNSRAGMPIYDLVNDALDYIDKRTDFWRQQEPLYARQNKKGKPKKKTPAKKQPADITKFLLRSLEEIDQAMAEGDPERGLNKAQVTMRTVKSLNNESVPNKEDVMGNLHSCMGNAYLEMDNSEKALEHHQEDLKIAKKIDNNSDGISRAYDNLGRVYAKMGRYSEAVDCWMEKLPLCKTPLESTWLHHEIGRCHLEMKNYQDAKEYGQKSLAAAHEAGDNVWQLNAKVLVSQAEVKLGELQEALESFQEALDLAKILEDEEAEKAISKAIKDVNERIARGVQESEKESAETQQVHDETQQVKQELAEKNEEDQQEEHKDEQEKEKNEEGAKDEAEGEKSDSEGAKEREHEEAGSAEEGGESAD